MPTDTLQRFREKKLKLGGAARVKRQGELLEEMRADAVAVIALASKIRIVSERKKPVEQLLAEMRAASEELRAALEGEIATAISLADEAARIWEAAVGDSASNRASEAETLRGVLGDAEQALREAFRGAQEHAHIFERPLARLDELEVKAAEFPLWARECLARWEMLDRPAPTLDPERVARAQAAYARGEHEDMDGVLSRVQAGGAWLKE